MTFVLSDSEFAEAVATLRDLLRIDTTNPPGNERPAAELIAGLLRADGLTPEFAGASPGRPNLACKLPGGARGVEDRRSMVLSCHLDVVPADPARWTHPPFAGVEVDGCLWGRGAIDMKGFAVMALTVFRLLKRRGAALNRDLIFAAVADEETGAELGSQWLVDHRPDLLGGQPEYVLNEVGGFTLHQRGRRFYPVQVAEKGVAWLRLTARGLSGHSSLPTADNALVHLAWAIDRIARTRLPWHPSGPAFGFLAGLAGTVAASLLATPAIGPRLLPLAIADRTQRASVEAILRNTANPTVIRNGGTKINVIPGDASVEIDGRLAPGQSAGDLVRELRSVLRDPDGQRYEITILRTSEAAVFSADTPLFQAIRDTVTERDPGAVVVPSIVPGFTDSKNYARLGATCYGFYPLRLPPELNFAALFHGDDERIPLEGFRWGIETLGTLLGRFLVNR